MIRFLVWAGAVLGWLLLCALLLALWLEPRRARARAAESELNAKRMAEGVRWLADHPEESVYRREGDDWSVEVRRV